MIKDDKLDRRIWFDSYRQAMAKAILKAMNHKPDFIWLMENQKKFVHKYFRMGLDCKI